MLSITIKKDEKIIVGENVSIMLVEIQGKQVRLGIEAPAEMPIHRSEMHEQLSAKDLKTVALARHQNTAITAEEE